MAQIQIATDQGVVTVDVGDTKPDQSTLDKISKSLIDQGHTFEDVNINKQLPSETGVFKSGAPDLSKLSLEEIRAYTAEAKRLGIDPASGEQIRAPVEAPKEGEEDVPKVKIDTSGVKNVGLRGSLAMAENDREYRLRLLDAGFTDGQFFKDPEKGYVLKLDTISPALKTKYNLPESGNLAIEDEDMFTKEDFAEFFAQARGPLAGGIITSLAASGVGLPAAAVFVGLGTAGGYLFDEAIEYAQGVQAQDARSVRNTAIKEGLIGALGEGVGRAVARLLGRMIKGPLDKEANEARTLMRDAIAAGALPTVRGANTSPILGRLQAIYEGVFPSVQVAEQNAKYVAGELSKLSRGTVDSEKILAALKRDVTRIYGDKDAIIKEVNGNLKNVLDEEVAKSIRLFGELDPKAGEALAKSIEYAKRTFDQDVDLMYSKANSLIGEKDIIDATSFVRTFERLVKQEPALQLDQKGLGQVIRGLGDVKAGINTDVRTMNSIRTALRHASFDKDLIGTSEDGILRVLREAIDNTFIQSEARLFQIVKEGGPLRDASGRIIMPSYKVKEAKEGFDLLREAGQFYKKGVGRFRQLDAQELFRSYKSGVNFNPERIFAEKGGLLIPDNAKALNEFLDTVVPSGPNGGIIVPSSLLDVVPDAQIMYQGNKISLRSVIGQMPDNEPLKQYYQNIFESSTKFAGELAEARTKSASMREAMRNTMASKYLDKAFNESRDLFGNVNAAKIAENINQLGSTSKVLFGKDYDKVMNILQDMQSLGKKITPEDMASISARPIAEQVEALNALLKEKKDLSNIGVVRAIESALRTQDLDQAVNAIFKRGPNGVESIKKAKSVLGKDSETFQQIQDLSMSRILASMGDPDMAAPEFIDAVFTGKAARELERVLNSYGRGTLDEMFGKEATKELFNFARVSRLISQEPVKGLGALAPATIAQSLGIVGFIQAPFATLSTAVAIRSAARILRKPWFLRMITRPTGVRPGSGVDYDKLGRMYEMIYEAIGLATGQAVESDQPSPPGFVETNIVKPAMDALPEMDMSKITSQIPNITGPAAASSASRVNPILVPDPTTRATFGG